MTIRRRARRSRLDGAPSQASDSRATTERPAEGVLGCPLTLELINFFFKGVSPDGLINTGTHVFTGAGQLIQRRLLPGGRQDVLALVKRDDRAAPRRKSRAE